MAKAKIIATLGPASNSRAILRKMYIAGLDIVRLNFSHGITSEHLERINIVRSLNREMRRAIKIMQDLEGYRIRVGRLSKPRELKKGTRLYITQEDVAGTKDEISFDYAGPLETIKKHTLVYIDDGKIMLEVLARRKKYLETSVLVPGILRPHKGINIPEARLIFEPLTEKDKKDVEVAIEYKLDYVAQSFVGKAGDIRLLKDIVKAAHHKCKIFAKIESRDAISNIDEIIDEADGIIVARGDMGICVPIYKVPVIQKEIVKKCRRKNKPVAIATQMLDSMAEELLPTRAEVSDVANAVTDGATHLMLSGETAVGKHPHKVVDMMNKIIGYTEEYLSS